MSGKPTQDEMVRLLDGAYDSLRLPTYSGEEFLAQVQARALSGWLIRGAVILGAALLIALAVIGYKMATTLPAHPDESPALLDSGAGAGVAQSPTRLGDRTRILEAN